MQCKNYFTDVSKMVLYEVVMNEQEKSSNRLYIGIVIVALAFCAAYFLRSCGNIYDNGAGVDNVRGGIEQGTESNTKLQEQLGGAESTADEIEGSINAGTSAIADAERTAGTITSDIDIAADAITKCQRIVNGIKQRNEAAAAQP